MEHLSLEIFDLSGTGSKYASLPEDTTITIIDTSEIFGSGDVWSYNFTLNVHANAHIFGSAGDMHGARLHEQINKRRARLWVEGLPLYLGYLKLDDEVEVDNEGNVDVRFESGQKTFDEMIEGVKAREVSVGDVVIGVALNRKRVVKLRSPEGVTKLEGLEAYAAKDPRLSEAARSLYVFHCLEIQTPNAEILTPYVQQWPKLVKSHGKVWNSSQTEQTIDYSNVQTPYDSSHPFCNINICYQFKANNLGEEIVGRGYTMRLAHGNETTDGGDNQTRYNNAPNFYLLYFIDRLFKDTGIYVEENQAADVEDLRRVFMLNYGCYYEEIENSDLDTLSHTTPSGKLSRYGQYYMPLIDEDSRKYLLEDWEKACMQIQADEKVIGKVLLRDVEVIEGGVSLLTAGSIEGIVTSFQSLTGWAASSDLIMSLDKDSAEDARNAYSAYLAYATGDNYPNVDISEIIEAMKSMFGVRFIFSDNYRRVRIVLLRNLFRSQDVQQIRCEILDADEKIENSIRGFRMTYGKGKENTAFFYKGFNDMFQRAATIWKDTTDKHNYSLWSLDADYGSVKQYVSAMNKTCYVTPATGNAYVTKVDEEEDVLFPSLFEVAGFMDAEDGDCTGENETVEEVTIGADPLVVNEVGNTYASLFTGDLKAPSPEDSFEYASKIATFGRITRESLNVDLSGSNNQTQQLISVKGKLDVYVSEGFQIRMKDNYSISNGGTPFDESDPGLCFGIMRGSGADARVAYYPDTIENENNDYWEIVPGSGAVVHSDTCDNYGNLWDYNGVNSGVGALAGRISLKLRAEKPNPMYKKKKGQQPYIGTVSTKIEAAAAMTSIFTSSNADLLNRTRVSGSAMRSAGWNSFTGDYATLYSIQRSLQVKGGITVEILWTPIRQDGTVLSPGQLDTYIGNLGGEFVTEDIVRLADAAREGLIVDVNTTQYRKTLLDGLQAIYYAEEGETVVPVVVDPSVVINSDDRYLRITNENLQHRGLCDQFYKEYSYWVRNARIAKREVRMELAQFLAIDKTKKATVGDITGFIRKMQFTVSNNKGLGTVSMEIMYI